MKQLQLQESKISNQTNADAKLESCFSNDRDQIALADLGSRLGDKLSGSSPSKCQIRHFAARQQPGRSPGSPVRPILFLCSGNRENEPRAPSGPAQANQGWQRPVRSTGQLPEEWNIWGNTSLSASVANNNPQRKLLLGQALW